MPPSSTPSSSNELLTAVQQTLADHRMIAAGDRVLVGVSGGPDSMVLLHILSRLAPAMEIRLGVAHLNHCLRGTAADRDAELVYRAAADLHHPCHMGRAHVLKVKRRLGLSLEEAARRVRYAFFSKIMAQENYNKLALGHHLEDNAEQMLIFLLRGAGPTGLSGIAPTRRGGIIRPLIRARRSQIDAFAANEAISCTTDESNADVRFIRNRIRHQLMPLLESDYSPRIKEQLSRLADIVRMEEAWIGGLIAAPYEDARLDREDGALTLCAETLRRAHPALARRLIRRALEDLSGNLRRISFAHVQAIQGLLAGGASGKTLHLPGGIRIHGEGGRLTLEKAMGHRGRTVAEPPPDAPVAETAFSPPFPPTVKIQSMGIGLRFSCSRPDQLPHWQDIGPERAFFDLDRISPPLVLRPARPGDRFTPLGAGGSQKLKKFFIDHHISRNTRSRIPVLADRHRIIWLVGQRIDDRVKVTPATMHVLVTEFFLLDTR